MDGWVESSEKEAFMANLATIPSEDLSIYTDGSSYGNPGPSGSGFSSLSQILPFPSTTIL
jgi:hypothetical protein